MKNSESFTGIDLAKFRSANSWNGEKVDSVLNMDDISTVILLRAVTSAPSQLDIINIIRSLKESDRFETDGTIGFENEFLIWDAVLLTNSGKYFRYLSNGKLICVSSEDGFGYIRDQE